MALETIYRRATDLVARNILDETLLVPIRGELADLQRIFALNPVAASIWRELDSQRDVAALRDGLVQTYEVEPAQAEADLVEFVTRLSALGLIIEVQSP